MTDTSAETPLADLLGSVGSREFDAAPEWSKPELETWIRALPGLDDEMFRSAAGSAIHASALVQRFRGNWEHEHCKASAAHQESKRRWAAAGHDEDCRGSQLYDLAFRDVWIGQWHSPRSYPVKPCDCGRVSGDVDTAPEE